MSVKSNHEPIARGPQRMSTMRIRAVEPMQAAPANSAAGEPMRPRYDTPTAIFLPRPALRDRPVLTVLSGTNAGAIHHLDRTRATLLGRGEDCDIVIDDPAVSRHHARIVREADGSFAVVDLGSTNGTFVNAQRVARVGLSTGFRVQLGPETVFRFALVDETEDALHERLYELSTRDALTGVFNRKYFFERLGAELSRAVRNGDELGVVMFDLDHFKAVNDTLGHVAGDRVLRAVATRASQVLRAADVLARYGGEELVAILRARDVQEAVRAAERVREAIETLTVSVGDAGDVARVTISAGVATLRETGTPDPTELIARADARLYRAKITGRNRVIGPDEASGAAPPNRGG
jgi:diguanylate cyclase (GGDEF)-like protein